VIWGRGKKKVDEAEDLVTSDELELGGEADLADIDSEGADREDAPFDADELDARFWRSDGPFDVSEVDLEEEPAEGEARIDLGSMIVTGFAGAELRLQVTEETSQIVSAMLIHESSALELGAYAAPRSGGLWAELRDEMSESATESGGSASLVRGPFGVELRRLLPVTTPEGEEGYQPSRMWVVEGPRWLLRGIIYGEAALAEGVDAPVDRLLSAFRRVIVRRGDEAMAPGDLLPLTMPDIASDDDDDENT